MSDERHKPDGRTDFDFLIGNWTVHNRRLKDRLKGCTDWEVFKSTCRCRHILGGLGNLDEFTMERASGRVEAVRYAFTIPPRMSGASTGRSALATADWTCQ